MTYRHFSTCNSVSHPWCWGTGGTLAMSPSVLGGRRRPPIAAWLSGAALAAPPAPRRWLRPAGWGCPDGCGCWWPVAGESLRPMWSRGGSPLWDDDICWLENRTTSFGNTAATIKRWLDINLNRNTVDIQHRFCYITGDRGNLIFNGQQYETIANIWIYFGHCNEQSDGRMELCGRRMVVLWTNELLDKLMKR